MAAGKTKFWAAVDSGDLDALADTLDGDTAALAPAMPLLSSWRRQSLNQSIVEEWRYRVVWRPTATPRVPAMSGTWAIVAGPGQAARAEWFAAAVRGAGGQPVVTGKDLPRDTYAGVLCLLSLDAESGLADSLALLQTVVAQAIPGPVWLVTSGAVSVGRIDRLRDPAQAMVWGLGLVAGLERPAHWGGLLDLPDQIDHRTVVRALAALGGDEDQLAVRASGVFARRMVRAGEVTPIRVWRPQGTVLVTGGTGALGGHIARWLVDGGADKLLLTSRRGLDAPGAADLRSELTERGIQRGVEVVIQACDVADRDAVAALLAEHPVHAVVHAAGVAQSTGLTDIDATELAEVVSAKVAGAIHLDALTSDLDAFVLFSSGAGIWGGAGQAAYAAGNAYLDALAQRRRDQGRPATAVAWGGWADGGMANDDAIKQLGKRGLHLMDPSLAISALQQALDADETTLTVANIEWARFVPGYAAARTRPLISEIPGARAAMAEPEQASTGEGEEGLRATVLALPEPERAPYLLDLIRTQAAAALGYPDASAIEPGRAFRDLGFDSLTAVDVRNRLRTATGRRLPATLVFDYPTPVALADHLLADLLGAAPTAPAAVATSAVDEPIAIIGMSCRYPGGVNSPDDLWHLVMSGIDALSGFPDDRSWDLDNLYHPDPDHPGTSYVREGGFVYDAGHFDAAFFGISPREAIATDPQQRMLLEATWETFERAGIDPATLKGSRSGVFVGTSYVGYGVGGQQSGGEAEGFLLAGTGTAAASGRVSYTFGLEGPAVTVDTACSSSLVAIHLACQALRQNECELAVAGGVAVLALPTSFTEFSRQRGLAADGRCKPFAAAADGTGWGEGAGMLLVERLSDAVRNGHPVLAVIRGTATNQDGASNGLTAPNGPSQQRVIRQALANSRLRPSDVDAVEAHGTGTTLGDPIEAQAVLATYGQDREHPLWLGSVKSNIGHTQSASGVAGVIKMVLALRNGVLPRTLHIDEPTPHVDWTEGAVELLAESQPWPETGRVRRAGVSSFGGSGTNAHLIVEQYVAPEQPSQSSVDNPLPWVLSGRSPEAVRDQAERLSAHLSANPDLRAADVAYSLATTRAGFEHRAAIVATDPTEALSALSALARGESAPSLVRGVVRTGKVAFVFPGQGAQWVGMAAELAESSEVFAAEMHACAEALAPHVSWSLLDAVRGGDLDRVDVVQPALFAVMVSLAALWRAHGVEPAAVIGHSQGEIAAAYVSGALSLADAAKIVALRSQAIVALAGHGGMVSVSLPADEIRSRLVSWGGRISVAAVNGPTTVVVAGEVVALEEFLAACEADGVRARRIPVDYASHSVQVERIADELHRVLAGIEPGPAAIPCYSTVTGEWLDTSIMDADYWYRNLRQTVGFDNGTRALVERGIRFFVEVSPHPVLIPSMGETLDSIDELDPGDAVALGTLRRDEGGMARFLLSAAELHANGCPLDLETVFADLPVRRVDLPTYPFQRERYWLDAVAPGAGDVTAAGLGTTDHPLLGAAVPLATGDGVVLTGRLSLRTHPWLADHAVMGTVLLPGTAFVELAVRAGQLVGCDLVEELTLGTPLVLGEQDSIAVQLVVGAPDEEDRRELSVFSRPADGDDPQWTKHASGRLASGAEELPVVEQWPPAGADPVGTAGFYDGIADLGYGYGPAFQALGSVWLRGGELFAEVRLPEALDTDGFAVHPALLDAALHGIGLLRAAQDTQRPAELPFSWRGVQVRSVGATALRVRLTESADGIEVVLADDTGAPVGWVRSLVARPVGAELTAARRVTADSLFRVDWSTAVDLPTAGTSRWALLDADDLKLERSLTAAGNDVTTHADVDAFAESGGEADVAVAQFVLAPTVSADLAAAVEDTTARALRLVQAWLLDERFADVLLVVATRGAVSTGPGADLADLTHAPVWGLLRTAQSEHPGRFLLVDVDDRQVSADAITAVSALTTGETQLALRGGLAFAPRLARIPPAVDTADTADGFDDGEGTVLITGATGALGGALARHLVVHHGVRHLLLTSRSGLGAPGARELAEDLTGLGAEVTIASCDVADREVLARTLAQIPAAHPLTAVVHTAAVLDDAVLTTMTPTRIAKVLAPKVRGAYNLHELTQDLDLRAFTLFSSAAGVFGGAGQGNYAAANVFLDALAQHRQALGLPGVSLAWGPWAQRTGMTAELTEADVRRVMRSGLGQLSTEDGMALFSAACATGESFVVPMAFSPAALRGRGAVLPILRGLVPTPRTDESDAAALRQKLATTPDAGRRRILLDLVRGQVATVLGYATPGAIDPNRGFLELGLDSLTGVELRNRLSAATGLRLPATLVFDHPTAAALAQHLRTELAPERQSVADGVLAELTRLEQSLTGVGESDRSRVAARLRALAARWDAAPDRPDKPDSLESASADETFDLLDSEFEKS